MKRDEQTSGRPDLSAAAKVALWLALGVPLVFSYASLLLGGDIATWRSQLQTLVPIAGVVASATIAARFWDRIPVLRFVPVAYGVAMALSVTIFEAQVDVRAVGEAVAAGAVIGFGVMFAIWIETNDRRPANTPLHLTSACGGRR